MCGIAGYSSFQIELSKESTSVEKMISKLSRRGPDDFGIFVSKHVHLGHRRLVVVDPAGGSQPMKKCIENNNYIIVYNGELYNTEEIRSKLLQNGFAFEGYSDTEVLLFSYIYWGESCLDHLNGIFAFVIYDEKKQQLFLARDPLGVKPLFYTLNNNMLIFASEIKALLEHENISPVLDEAGTLELFSLGPSRCPNSGILKGIKELPPAHCMTYSKSGVKLKEYWTLKAEENNYTLDTSVEYVRFLFEDSVKRQLVSDVPLCTFLSGGLDSSAISAVTSMEYKKNGKVLNTYSVDYEDNSNYFKSSEFQPDPDSDWIPKISSFLNTNHHNIVVGQKELCKSLREAVLASDLPGMADVDSSLYLFCKEVRKNEIVALSGECADELFGGYPWYTNEKYLNLNFFPWSGAMDERKKLLSHGLKHLDVSNFAKSQYDDSLKKVPHLDNESSREFRMREMFYLNIKWFMLNLLNRKDRMSMSNSLEVRVPFADYRLVEFAFNLPTEYKFCDNREKGILRRAFADLLPNEVVQRKKSPYPKTHNPIYTNLVKDWLQRILDDKSSPVLNLIDVSTARALLASEGGSIAKPWYGQLMAGPQLLAYIIQINEWLKEYKIKLEV